ncbi:putative U3 small nucleolar RNA-associated protein 11 [Grifola frondosa]|uniref:Putative U3 small nucleolar RNA-associated protein 11 n=1 Tax=Grifola frondosa TaxID=5627 RepID=A0A1C7LWQ4_GRIFR|nr:putative U3 small nucleolar RNA-associated protein 11 [Grifola frondosa]
MSSLRNSLHRRNHKERSQLSHRARLGILEKHKDYVLRARDYHSKQDRIQRLRQKAADRNKDEFYFGMVKQRTKGGVHVQDRGNQALPVDIVKVLKTQDENYLRTMRTAGLKKIDKLKSQLSALANLVHPDLLEAEGTGEDRLDEQELEVLRGAGVVATPTAGRKRKSSSIRKRKHLIFAENEDEAKAYSSSSKTHTSAEDQDQTGKSEDVLDLGWKTPEEKGRKKKRSRSAMELDGEDASLDLATAETATGHRARLLKELSARLARDKQLRYAERELEMQKFLMGKGASRKLQGVEKVEGKEDGDEDEDAPQNKQKVDEKTWKPRIYKWRLERKR